MDAVRQAASGHTGTAMALAPLAHVLWTRIMTYDASAPDWPDRDRFVLSAGHASMLLYGMLHLTGHGLTLDDIRSFRQWGSRTPGHPEVGCTPGVEVTTGPLGQGFGNAVGMAFAERRLRAQFGADLFDHRIFAICSDGDLMEGLSHEAASLAGHQGLGRLICIYDDNHITIDGPTELAYSDDAAARFAAYGWHVVQLGEAANDLDALTDGLQDAIAVEDRPSMVIVRSHIGWPLPTAVDTAAAHGAILDDEELAEGKRRLGLPADEPFFVPDEVLAAYREAGGRGQEARESWEKRLANFNGDRAALDAVLSGRPLPHWADELPSWEPGEAVATRVASHACLNALAPVVPALVSGGADLTGNTGTKVASDAASPEQPDGRLTYFGVREHAMAAVLNGMALHGGTLPVGGTFLVFSDYMRPSVRLAAISGAKVVFVWTHDSVGVGEDGPTHQPIEHVAALRAIPGLRVIRPADANEVAGAWQIAVDSDGPTALILTRQNVPVLAGTSAAGVANGAYIVRKDEAADLVIIGTGSELQLCVEAADRLAGTDIRAQVVSMPCWELVGNVDGVIWPDRPVLGVEAGTSYGWDRWADATVTIDRFGASAPGDVALAELGFTVDAVVDAARRLLNQ